MVLEEEGLQTKHFSVQFMISMITAKYIDAMKHSSQRSSIDTIGDLIESVAVDTYETI